MIERHGEDDQRDDDFDALVEASYPKDTVIVEFERAATRVIVDLNNQYSAVGLPVSPEEIQELEEYLNSQWPHCGRYAKLSGRIYVQDKRHIELVSVQLGDDSAQADDGSIHYLVEDVAVLSRGVQIVPVYTSSETPMLEGYKVTYLYSLQNDDSDTQCLYAYPEELSQHEYPTHIHEEAARRLEQRWPRHYIRIKNLFPPDASRHLGLRLADIARRLQVDLKKSEELQQLLETYINHYAGADSVLPYIVTIRGEFAIYDGNDPDILSDDDDEWARLTTGQDLGMAAYSPTFRLRPDAKGQIKIYCQFARFNAENLVGGSDVEYVDVNVENITGFYSLRARESLATQALRNTLGGNLLDALPEPELIAGAQGNTEPKYVERSGSAPSIIEDMRQFESVIRDMIELVKEASRKQYDSQDDALSASRALVNERLIGLLTELGPDAMYRIMVGGPGVTVPKGDIADQTPWSFEKLSNGETLEGIFYTLTPTVVTVLDKYDNVQGYRAAPSIVMRIAYENHTLLAAQSEAMAELTIAKNAIVALDGSAEISLPGLDSYDRTQRLIKEHRLKYGKTPIVRRIQKLQDIMYIYEQAGRFTPLIPTKEIAQLGKLFHRFSNTLEKQREITAMLDELFVQREVRLRWSFIIQEDNANLLNGVDDSQLINGAVEGTIIDIRSDLFESDLALVLMNRVGELTYVRLSSITEFKF